MKINIILRSTAKTFLSLALLFFGLSQSPLRAGALGLTLVDINNPVAGEVAENADGSITVTAGGNDTWDASDSFTYLYEQKDGDFDVKVQVLDVQVDDAGQQDSAKASLMARANLTPGSPDVMINATPVGGANYIETIWRPQQDAGTTDSPVNQFHKGNGPYDNTFRAAPLYPIWLRLQRKGNVFITSHSQDGFTWTGLAEFCVNPANFPNTVYVGLSTVAHLSPAENQDFRVHATYANYGNGQPKANINGAPAGADNEPGQYPNVSVTAANFKIVVPADGIYRDSAGNDLGFITYNAGNKNQYILTIDGQGPIPWSAPGYNQGDLDISLSPRDAVAAQSNLGPYSNPDRNISQTDYTKAPAQAWIPSTRSGLVIGSIRKNTQQWNDNGAGGPTSPFHGFAAVSVDFSSRKGYSMNGGNFENGEIYFSFWKLGEVDPALPPAASPFGLREANMDVALAWFPFSQGWKAGYVNDATKGTAFWLKLGSHSPALCDNTTDPNNTAGAIVTWLDLGGSKGGLAELALPGVDSVADGMLFAMSNDDSSDNEGQFVTAVPKPDGTGWTIAIRQDDANYDPLAYSAPERSEFEFLFVPYDARNLTGAHVKGASGAVFNGRGDFALKHLGEGRYELTIPGMTGTSGMILLQNAGIHPVYADVADDSVLSYEYSGSGHFIIEARHVEDGSGAADVLALRDTDFYFAWVDFANPMAPPFPPCVEPVVPDGGSPPGPCPNYSATAANWVAKGSSAGFTGDVEMNLEGNGPIPWSIIRYNRGDFAVRLSPVDPVGARENLGLGFTQYGNSDTTKASGQVWGPDREKGIVIPTPRMNGPIDWGDGAGPFYPTVGAGSANSTGNSYNMVSGVFGGFGSGGVDINTGKAGDQSGEPSPEGNFNFATSWFPYDQGWVGGVVGAPDATGNPKWESADSHSRGLLPSVVTWVDDGAGGFGGNAILSLPGINSLTDGLLFTSSSDGNSDVNIIASAPQADGSGWVVTIREDSASDPSSVTSAAQSEFQFLYVPYGSQNLIGGRIDGKTGTAYQSRGTFTLARSGAGAYDLQIPGKNGDSGVLLLQSASFLEGSTTLANNSFFSYEYSAASGKFVIQSRRTEGPTGSAPLGDADFYFAWVDFANPLSPPSKIHSPLQPAAPTLSYSRSGNQLTFSWVGAGFILQSNDNLANPAGWAAVANGGQSPVTVIVGPGKKFFRLKSL